MNNNRSSQDLNDIALANLRELIASDPELLPEWKSTLAAILKHKIPRDLSAVQKLMSLEQPDDSLKKT